MSIYLRIISRGNKRARRKKDRNSKGSRRKLVGKEKFEKAKSRKPLVRNSDCMYLTVEDIKLKGSCFEELPDESMEKRLENLQYRKYCNTRFVPTETEWNTDLKKD